MAQLPLPIKIGIMTNATNHIYSISNAHGASMLTIWHENKTSKLDCFGSYGMTIDTIYIAQLILNAYNGPHPVDLTQMVKSLKALKGVDKVAY